jgi:GxxExxY protein
MQRHDSIAGEPYGSAETLLHRPLTEKIIGVFYDVYNELGHGFLESVYSEAMEMALADAGLEVQTQVAVPVWFRGRRIGEYKADFLVEGKILIELKAVRALDASHQAQLMHYLKATSFEVGLLFNFGSPRPEFRRLVFENSRKQIRENPRKSAVGSS